MNKLLSLFCLSVVCFLFSISSCKKDDPCVPGTTAEAGQDQLVPGVSTTLIANTPTIGEGTWSIVTGSGGSFDDVHSPTALFTGSAGAYTLRWTISGCPETQDDVQITLITDPTITAVDKTSVINGEIITVTGFNFSANFQGNSQIIIRKTGSADTYSTILSLTSTEIKFVMANSTNLGTFTLVCWKRESVATGAEFPSTFDVTINAPGVSQFFVSSTLPSSTVNAGDNLIASVKNGGSLKGDYTVKLIHYNYTTGAKLEYAAPVVSFTAGTMDALEFTVPADIPTGLTYNVAITYNGTTLITGWNGVLSVN